MTSPFLDAKSDTLLERPSPVDSIEHFIGGSAVFPRMLTDIRSAVGRNAFVYIASWNCQSDMKIQTPGGVDTLESAIKTAAQAGAEVRLLLWAGTQLEDALQPFLSVYPELIAVKYVAKTFLDEFIPNRKNNIATRTAVAAMRKAGCD